MSRERRRHWDAVFATRPADRVSWYEAEPTTSLRLVVSNTSPPAGVIDIGAGASPLVDALDARGYADLTVLDVSREAVDAVRRRLGDAAGSVSFVVADVVEWVPDRRWDAWHDRAVFHFLVEHADRHSYVMTAARAVVDGGVLVIGCFAPDGPTSCSGLPTARYGPEELEAIFTPSFRLTHAERQEHRTPSGSVQAFAWAVFRRDADMA